MSQPEDVGSVDLGSGTIDPRDFLPGEYAAEQEFYAAVLVLEATSDSPTHEPLYEESFVLLTAESEEEAAEKAREYGKQQETSYHDEHHQLVTWKLKQVVEVKPIEDATFDDGSELYSRFFRDYASYRSFSGEEL